MGQRSPCSNLRHRGQPVASGDPSNGHAIERFRLRVFTRRAFSGFGQRPDPVRACAPAPPFYPDKRTLHALDPRVIAQLSQAVRRSKANIIVTNGAKTHVVMRIVGLRRGSGRWVAFHHGNTATSRKFLVYQRIALWSIRRADRVLTPCAALRHPTRARWRLSQSKSASQPVCRFVHFLPFLPVSLNN